MENLKFFKLLSSVGASPKDVTYSYVYSDHLFYDYIAKVGDRFLNFCLITATNSARYEMLIKLDTWMSTNEIDCFERPEVKVIEVGGQQWFYESIPFYPNLGKLSYQECLLLDHHLYILNQHVLGFAKNLTDQEKSAYNAIIMEYVPDHLRAGYTDVILEYGDIFRSFDCNRISRTATGFKLSGYQAFLFYNKDYNMAMTLIMSMMNDTYSEKQQKLAEVSSDDLNRIKGITSIQDDRVQRFPDQFYKIDEFAAALTDIKAIICNESQ